MECTFTLINVKLKYPPHYCQFSSSSFLFFHVDFSLFHRYDYSGTFAYKMGFPCKSGVGGALLIVIPGVCGFCTWSPRLDDIGNSVRGVHFCKLIAQNFSFHSFAPLSEKSENKNEDIADSSSSIIDRRWDPTNGDKMGRHHAVSVTDENILEMLWASYDNDLDSVRQLVSKGVNVNVTDYDGRCALHIAACEHHVSLVKYLLRAGATVSTAIDRYGGTPLSDAQLQLITNEFTMNEEIVSLLEQAEEQEQANLQSKQAQLEISRSSSVAFSESGESATNTNSSQNGTPATRAISALLYMSVLNPEKDEDSSGNNRSLLTPGQMLYNALQAITEDQFTVTLLQQVLSRCGIQHNDRRIQSVLQTLPNADEPLTLKHMETIASHPLLLRGLRGELAVPDWPSFARSCDLCFVAAEKNTSGTVATYIPVLAQVDPQLFGVSSKLSLCSVLIVLVCLCILHVVCFCMSCDV